MLVSLRRRPRRLVLELHQVEIAGHDVETRAVDLLDHPREGQGVLVADRIIKRAPVEQVEFG